MATLNIRNLPDEVHARLRIRAARASRSMEAEARAILTAACAASDERESTRELQRLVDRLYGSSPPRRVVSSLLAERRKDAERE